MLEVNREQVLNITNGEYFNEYFIKKFGGYALPFCEAMMDGDTVPDVYSSKFIDLRTKVLGVSREEYLSKAYVYDALKDSSKYSSLHLWFGKDTFCQMNLLTLLSYLEQIEFVGRVFLNYIDDETFEIIDKNIEVPLGSYKEIYNEILVSKQAATETGILVPRALALYFDYHSIEGKLARLVKENPEKDEHSLLCLLLEHSTEYGLSDVQAKKLIARVRMT